MLHLTLLILLPCPFAVVVTAVIRFSKEKCIKESIAAERDAEDSLS